MNKISRLVENYSRHIAVPWRDDTAPAQRVIFCVYSEYNELRLRLRLDEFETVTHRANHNWELFDLTNTFPDWMASQRYAKSYLQSPEKLKTLLPKLEDFITTKFQAFCEERRIGGDDVVALCGVGSLFGFLKVKAVVSRLAPLVPGRMVVFFPGSYEDNNYRLLDAYDGWEYLAIPITPDQ